jgi:hypothetical protein
MARPSSIDKLPAALRDQLHEYLRDPAVSQKEATQMINDAIEEAGGKSISKSSVNRYAMRMEAIGARLRDAREISKLWIGKLGSQPAGETGRLLNEVLRTLAVEITLPMMEGDEKPSAKVINQLALAVQRLEKAASDNEKRDAEIRKRAAAEAADAAEAAAVQAGMTADTVQRIKNDILGIAA